MKYKIINLKTYGDERGYLTALEGNKNIPFDIKRVFYIHGTKGQNVVRGDHANRNSKFVLLMISGSCDIKIFDDTGKFETVTLDEPAKGLYLENLVYKEMHNFSDGAVMLVLSSEYFDETEYIDSHQDLLKELQNG